MPDTHQLGKKTKLLTAFQSNPWDEMRWDKAQKSIEGNTEEVVVHKIPDGLPIVNTMWAAL